MDIHILTKEEVYERQLGIIDMGGLQKSRAVLIGAGSVGSMVAITLAKMGVKDMQVWDNDTVEIHNLPSQFYRIRDIGILKVIALGSIILEYTGIQIGVKPNLYTGQTLHTPVIIVTTDTMASRLVAFKQACKRRCWFIDARMGAELGIVFKINCAVKAQQKYYLKNWFSDDEAEELPCTARTIIYNVQMLSALVCRAYKSIIMKEKVPKQMIFNMTRIDEVSWMIDK